ncbi:hypothetical protein [Enterococcus sp. AZ109]|uniref:hypothetical protein n=1 Tax=Enterococcus sp. AZ109 TaxID=2774634 RepID=UPI003F20E3C4
MTDKIVIAATVEIPQMWMSKEEAKQYFGYKEHEPTFQKLLAEFKEHPDYCEGYRLPTYKVPIIRIDLFDKFLEWKHKNKFKRNKGA